MTGHTCPNCHGPLQWTENHPEAHEPGTYGGLRCDDCRAVYQARRDLKGGLYLTGQRLEDPIGD